MASSLLLTVGIFFSPAHDRSEEIRPAIVVLVPRVPDCQCEYAIDQFALAGPPACLAVTYNPPVCTPQPLCLIPDTICAAEKKCKGYQKIDFKVTNWGLCCPQPAPPAPQVSYQFCQNGQAGPTIPGGTANVVTVTIGGTPLHCEHLSDSCDSGAGKDEVSGYCGNILQCANPAAWAYDVVFTECCNHCPG